MILMATVWPGRKASENGKVRLMSLPVALSCRVYYFRHTLFQPGLPWKRMLRTASNASHDVTNLRCTGARRPIASSSMNGASSSGRSTLAVNANCKARFCRYIATFPMIIWHMNFFSSEPSLCIHSNRSSKRCPTLVPPVIRVLDSLILVCISFKDSLCWVNASCIVCSLSERWRVTSRLSRSSIVLHQLVIVRGANVKSGVWLSYILAVANSMLIDSV